MQTKVVIRDFETTENLQTYLQSKIEESIAPFMKNFDDSNLFVRVQEDRHRTGVRKPHFQCDVRLTIPGAHLTITVRKEGDQFYDCVQRVADTLHEVMSRKHRQLASLQARRKKTITSVPYDFEHYSA